MTRIWAKQWNMSFNPNPSKPAEEIVFSLKQISPHHLSPFFKRVRIKSSPSNKHSVLLLDSKLSYFSHNNEKMGVLSHLDYCNIIHHRALLTTESSLEIN